jgi:hypothetical protein
MAPLHNNGSYSTVACVFIAAGMCLPSRCLALNVYSVFAVPAFDRHVTILYAMTVCSRSRTGILFHCWRIGTMTLNPVLGIDIYPRFFCCVLHTNRQRGSWSSGRLLDTYSRGSCLKSRPGHRLSSLGFFRGYFPWLFSVPLEEFRGIASISSRPLHSRFYPIHNSFIILQFYAT